MAGRVKKVEVKVGALILLAVGLLIGFLVLLGDFSCAPQAVLYADFPTSADLKIGAPVKVTGVTIGKVTAVELWGGRPDPAHDGKRVDVRVQMKLTADSLNLLRADSRFYITTLGLLGERYIEIDPGTPQAPAVQAGQVLDGIGPMRMELVGADASKLIGDLTVLVKDNRGDINGLIHHSRNAVQQIDELLVTNKATIQEIIVNTNESLTSIRHLTAQIERAIGNGDDVGHILASLRVVSERLEEASPALKVMAGILNKADKGVGEVTTILATARQIVTDAQQDVGATLKNARQITEAVRDGRGSIGAFVADRELYDNVVEMLKDLKRHPWKFLWKE